jgi:hypothetical protein
VDLKDNSALVYDDAEEQDVTAGTPTSSISDSENPPTLASAPVGFQSYDYGLKDAYCLDPQVEVDMSEFSEVMNKKKRQSQRKVLVEAELEGIKASNEAARVSSVYP